LDDRHSKSGNIFLICNGAVNWLSKEQLIVTLSTAEAEYVAMSTATLTGSCLVKEVTKRLWGITGSSNYGYGRQSRSNLHCIESYGTFKN